MTGELARLTTVGELEASVLAVARWAAGVSFRRALRLVSHLRLADSQDLGEVPERTRLALGRATRGTRCWACARTGT